MNILALSDTESPALWDYFDKSRLEGIDGMYLKEAMADDINVRIYDGITGEKDCMEAIERAIFDGCRVIFTTSPRFLGASIRSGMKYPDIKILNCSLNSYSGH